MNTVLRVTAWEERSIGGELQTFLTEAANKELKSIWGDSIISLVNGFTLHNEVLKETYKVDMFSRKNKPTVVMIPKHAPEWVEKVALDIQPY